MSILSDFFKVLLGQNKYSDYRYPISEKEIHDLVSRAKILTLNEKEQEIIRDAIKNSRLEMTISIKKLDEVLRSLKVKNSISDNDCKGVLKVFEEYFERKFKHCVDIKTYDTNNMKHDDLTTNNEQ